VSDAIKVKQYSPCTEETYIYWIRQYILFHYKRHPAEMGAAEIKAFLTHLAKDENVSASTQNQALNALLFLYRNVLQKDLAIPIHALRAKPSEHLPTVLSKQATARMLSGMQGLHHLHSCSQPRPKGSPQPVRLTDASVNESKKRPPGLENAFHILILKRDYRAPAITGLNLYPYTITPRSSPSLRILRVTISTGIPISSG